MARRRRLGPDDQVRVAERVVCLLMLGAARKLGELGPARDETEKKGQSGILQVFAQVGPRLPRAVGEVAARLSASVEGDSISDSLGDDAWDALNAASARMPIDRHYLSILATGAAATESRMFKERGRPANPDGIDFMMIASVLQVYQELLPAARRFVARSWGLEESLLDRSSSALSLLQMLSRGDQIARER